MALYLTEEQTEYILEKFFNKEGECAGWRNIALKLLESGKCIVAGEQCIWIRGIGNFINTSKKDGFFDCLEYTFDLESFLKSNLFKQQINITLDDLSEKQKILNEKIGHLANLNRFANK
jgi:hypothetical protein